MKIIDELIEREGRAYTNDPKDSGGPTKFGITLATLTEYRGKPQTADEVKNLTEAEARQIYMAMYWTKPGYAKVAEQSARVAEELLDTGVNMGVGVASRFLQRALNGLNDGGKDLTVDGAIGPATLEALRAYLAKRGKPGEVVLLRYLNGLQVARYDEITANSPKNKRFMYGWILNRVDFA